MTGKAFDPKSIGATSAPTSVKTSAPVAEPIKTDPSKLIKPTTEKIMQREPGVPELLAAIKIMTPLVRKQLENPNFNASQYLDDAIAVAHRIGDAAIDDFKATRFVIASLVGSIIDEEALVSKTNEVMIEGIVKQIFDRNDSELNQLILQLADAFHANHHYAQEDVPDEDIIRAALLRNSEKVMSDVAHFSFWSSDKEKPEIAGKLIQIIGEVSLGLIDKMTEMKSVRSRELMIASVVARTASVVSECYRAMAFQQAAVAREENDVAKKAIIRKNARDTLSPALKEMVETRMNTVFDSAMTFCKSDIIANEVPK